MRAVIVGNIINNKEIVRDYTEAAYYLNTIGVEPVNPVDEILTKESIGRIVSVYIDIIEGCDSIFFTKSWIDCPCARIINGLSIATKKRVIYHTSIEEDKTKLIASIISAVEQASGYSYSDIVKPGKKRIYYFPRLIIMRLLDIHCNISDKSIEAIINRDNQIINFYRRKFKSEQRFNREFRRLFEESEKHLNIIVSQ